MGRWNGEIISNAHYVNGILNVLPIACALAAYLSRGVFKQAYSGLEQFELSFITCLIALAAMESFYSTEASNRQKW